MGAFSATEVFWIDVEFFDGGQPAGIVMRLPGRRSLPFSGYREALSRMEELMAGPSLLAETSRDFPICRKAEKSGFRCCIHIFCRRNHSWQGQLDTGNGKILFRSTQELLSLLKEKEAADGTKRSVKRSVKRSMTA